MAFLEDGERGEKRQSALLGEAELKLKARRNARFGGWVAGRLGLNGTAYELYIGAIVDLGLLDPRGDAAILEKVAADFVDVGQYIPGSVLNAKLIMVGEEVRGLPEARVG